MDNNVAYWRNIRGMSQQALADRIKMDRTNLSAIENGRKGLSKKKALIICGILDITFDQIFFTKDVSNSDTKEGA